MFKDERISDVQIGTIAQTDSGHLNHRTTTGRGFNKERNAGLIDPDSPWSLFATLSGVISHLTHLRLPSEVDPNGHPFPARVFPETIELVIDGKFEVGFFRISERGHRKPPDLSRKRGWLERGCPNGLMPSRKNRLESSFDIETICMKRLRKN